MKTFNTASALAALAVATALVTSSGAALANDHNYNGVTDNSAVTYSQVVEQPTTNTPYNSHNYNGSTATVPSTSQQRELSNATAAPLNQRMNSHNYSGDATASNTSAQYDDLSAANAAEVQNNARKTAWF